MMSSESKFIVSRLLEVDPKRRFKASDLIRESWICPETYSFGSSVVKPLRAGQMIRWKKVNL